jgi:energy-coupling factor transporter transmembrane protein EcfT
MRPLHPFTFWAIFTAITIGVIASDKTLVAIVAVGGAALVVHFNKSEGPWSQSFKWSLVAGVYLLIIRALTGVLIGVPRPGTVIFEIPRLSLPSWLPGIRIGGNVTLERLGSSLHEGVMIATVIALFGAANSVTSPHKLLRVLPARVYQLAVTLTIATSVFPQLIKSIQRIRDAQFLRSGRRPRISSIALPLLEESLDRAVNLAESMESRGYGQSKRQSRYRPITYTARDLLLIIGGFTTAVVMATL